MNRREFQIGPGAASLLLIAVVLCMGVLGALSLISARGDARLSERSADMAQVTAQLDAEAEQRLAELDGVLASLSAAASDGEYLEQLATRLPEGMTLSERRVAWTERAPSGRMLSCAVELAPLGAFPRAHWVERRVSTQLDEGENSGGALLFGDEGSEELLFGGKSPEDFLAEDAEPSSGEASESSETDTEGAVE